MGINRDTGIKWGEGGPFLGRTTSQEWGQFKSQFIIQSDVPENIGENVPEEILVKD